MALTITATDTEAQKPVNVIFEQTFLRRAQALCPYFAGTQPGEIARQKGTSTIKWRRYENITPTTTPLAELTGNATYMQGRDANVPSFTDVTATIAKYGQFFIVNEEVDLFNPNGTTDQFVKVLGTSAGRSLNRLQRNVGEDNATIRYGGGVASDGVVVTAAAAGDLTAVLNTLQNNDAMTFMPSTTGSQNVGTSPILQSYWAINHVDVSYDIAGLTGFKSVETYAGQTATAPGEYGYYARAGVGIRFIQTTEASIEADAGGAVGSTGLRSTNASLIDLYTILIYGEDAIGSVGLGMRHTDGIYRAGENEGSFELIRKGRGSGGTSDPFNEIETIAWKAWHAGAILNANWVRAIRVGATDVQA